VPKIIINNTINLFFLNPISISNHNGFRVLFDKIASVYFLLEKYIDIVALEMAGQWNQHCANCIGRFRSVLFFFHGAAENKTFDDQLDDSPSDRWS